jgi:hypothetical protein
MMMYMVESLPILIEIMTPATATGKAATRPLHQA